MRQSGEEKYVKEDTENKKLLDFQKILDDDEFYCLIKGLTESLQELMSYKFIQNMTFEEIAETMDKPVSTITSLYYRGLKKIKENLKI